VHQEHPPRGRNIPRYHIRQREVKSASEEGPSDDGCRPTWTEVPLWQDRLVPRRDYGVATLVGTENETSHVCYVAVREMLPM
jgi:hypothetical protein